MIAAIIPNQNLLSNNTGPHNIALPNGVAPLTITNWSDWTQWQVSVHDLEQITGYNLFSNLPVNVRTQLEARRTDRFIDGVPLLADQTLMSSEVLLVQAGQGVNLSPGQSDPDIKFVSDIGKISSSSEVSIYKSVVSDRNIAQIDSSKSSFLESSKSQIGSFESGIIQVTPKKGSPNQDTIIKVGSTQVGILKSNPIQVSPSKTGSFQVGIIEHNIHQLSSSKVRTYQNDSIQVQAGQVGATPINSSKISLHFETVYAIPVCP